MKLENQVISLQQAKRLKDLGISQDSLFYHTHFTGNGDGYFFSSKYNDIKHIKECVNYEEIGNYDYENAPLTPTGANRAGRYKIASAFTVAELGVMFGIGTRATDWLVNIMCHPSKTVMWNPYFLAKCLIEALETGITTAAEVNARLQAA